MGITPVTVRRGPIAPSDSRSGPAERRIARSRFNNRATHHSLLIAVLAISVAGFYVAGSALAAPMGGFKVWKPPFTKATTTTSHKVNSSGCHAGSLSPAKFDSTDGNVTGKAKTDATSCTAATSGTSDAYAQSSVLIELPSFIAGGTFTLTTKWHLNFKADVNMSGSTCSQSGQLDYALITFATAVLNDTTDTVLSENEKKRGNEIYGSTTVSTSFTSDLTVTTTAVLSGVDSYQIVAGFFLSIQSEVYNPTAVSTASCAASAEIAPLSGGTLATLVEAEFS